MPKTIRQTVTLNATPSEVYDAIMDSKNHSEFTNASARISKDVGGTFSVYDGYATGKNLELISGKKIVQTWRTTEWAKNDVSKVAFLLTKIKNGTRLTFTQSGVPDKHYKSIKQGWKDFYWQPLKAMFEKKS
jgi:activator of HSP90 ATPase